jgi:hypothetical protein
MLYDRYGFEAYVKQLIYIYKLFHIYTRMFHLRLAHVLLAHTYALMLPVYSFYADMTRAAARFSSKQ